ncbi:hypothetical protein GGS20DRAFT_155979 [Poronia punctata]|nr:hypothetical protein GGS20DRAFT_155979 [Poronia punctata]
MSSRRLRKAASAVKWIFALLITASQPFRNRAWEIIVIQRFSHPIFKFLSLGTGINQQAKVSILIQEFSTAYAEGLRVSYSCMVSACPGFTLFPGYSAVKPEGASSSLSLWAS